MTLLYNVDCLKNCPQKKKEEQNEYCCKPNDVIINILVFCTYFQYKNSLSTYIYIIICYLSYSLKEMTVFRIIGCSLLFGHNNGDNDKWIWILKWIDMLIHPTTLWKVSTLILEKKCFSLQKSQLMYKNLIILIKIKNSLNVIRIM